jgi:hypothetical protein
MTSRYQMLVECFTQYAKIKTLSEIVKGYYNEAENIKLGISLNILEDLNVRFFFVHYELEKINEIIKNNSIVSAKELEDVYIRKADFENELTELAKCPEDYPFNLGQTLELFDFFKKYIDSK